ncbi:MAG: isocitrate lyase/phosphoenolpyruvate mutase family protein [Candidatus Acidiferrales bacterium]|jgi:2-methylisocitrate lyase-like PEP mutase family enzyme
MSTAKQKAEDFRRMHQAPPILVLVNAWDVASARIFASVGARAIATSSAGVAFALGYPDGQKIPRRLMIESIARIAASVDLPVTADVESGYGPGIADATDTAQTVIDSGAIGLNFEDATNDPASPLFPVDAQRRRLEAIRNAAERAGIPLVINARTDVFLGEVGEPSTRFAEAVRRVNAYRESGADCLFIPGVTDAGTIQRLAREVAGPLNILVGPEAPPISELESLGVRRVSVGSQIMRATLATARDAARELLEKGTYRGFLDRTIPYDELNQLMSRDS